MDYYQGVVIDYLRADRAVFVNTEYCIQLAGARNPDPGRRWSCVAVAADFRHRAVYVCDVSFAQKLQPLLKKLAAWAQNWDAIKLALQRDCKLPADWRVHVWLFVPKESLELLDEKLEQLRLLHAPWPFKVKITSLEDVQPWRYSSWDREPESESTRMEPARK